MLVDLAGVTDVYLIELEYDLKPKRKQCTGHQRCVVLSLEKYLGYPVVLHYVESMLGQVLQLV